MSVLQWKDGFSVRIKDILAWSPIERVDDETLLYTVYFGSHARKFMCDHLGEYRENLKAWLTWNGEPVEETKPDQDQRGHTQT